MVYESVLAHIPFFEQLPPRALGDLSQKLQRRRYTRNQIIFHKNDPGSTLYIIISGKVKIILPSPKGESVLVAILSTGDFFGELSLFDKERRSATAIAAESLETLTLDQTDFIHCIMENPKAVLAILAELSFRLRRTNELLIDSSISDLPARLARRLLELFERYGQPGEEKETRINFRIKQQDLADMVNSSRESVNKLLKEFKGKNLIQINRGYISIPDMEALRQYAKYALIP